MPSELDLKNARVGQLVEKYYRGTGGVAAEKKLRAAKLIESRPPEGLAHCACTEAGPAAVQMTMGQLAELERKKELAKTLSGI
jgi:aromatic ring hydroxylase